MYISIFLFILQYRSKVSWQSLAPRSSGRKTQFSILNTFQDRVSRLDLEDQVSSFEIRVSTYFRAVLYILTFL